MRSLFPAEVHKDATLLAGAMFDSSAEYAWVENGHHIPELELDEFSLADRAFMRISAYVRQHDITSPSARVNHAFGVFDHHYRTMRNKQAYH